MALGEGLSLLYPIFSGNETEKINTMKKQEKELFYKTFSCLR